MINFDHPKNQSSLIKVIGVGGGGSNAVTHMFNQGIKGVDFIICNTDAQAMETSSVPTKIQIGNNGLGAGSIPSVGKEAAIGKIEEIKTLLEKNTKMLFITAGMGGGTGTGAAPVIASVAKELGILTVGIVTIPFSFEGRKRKLQAEQGIKDLRENVDTLLVVCNDKLRELHGDLKLSQAFSQADNILTTAAKGIAEIITVTGYINVDFEDVKTVMKNSGKALMGSATAEGESRAIEAVKAALASPLLNDSDIAGASDILLYISSGIEEISMDEVTEITEYIQTEAGRNAEIIWGNGTDEALGNKISVTIVATGFDSRTKADIERAKKIIIPLNRDPLTVEKKKEEKFENPIEEIQLISTNDIRNRQESTQENVLKMKPIQEKTERTITFSLNPPPIDFTKKTETPIEKIQITEPTLVSRADNQEVEPPKPKLSFNTEKSSDQMDIEEVERRTNDRVRKLKDLSIRLKSREDLEKLEREPAYMRRNVELIEPSPSSESLVSKFSLSEPDENDSISLKQNNSFLHDNVD